MVHVRQPKTHSIGDQVGKWQNTWQDDLENMMDNTYLGESDDYTEGEDEDDESDEDDY
jgi:hypothetical protein